MKLRNQSCQLILGHYTAARAKIDKRCNCKKAVVKTHEGKL